MSRSSLRRGWLAWGALVALCPVVVASSGKNSRLAPGAKSIEVGLALKAAKALVVGPDGDLVVDQPIVLVKNGKIVAIGPASETVIPDGYELVDCGSNWLCPGFIDLHCHVAGAFDINDAVYLTNPELRASCTAVPLNPAFALAVAGGVTSVLYIPGSATNMGGQGVLLKTYLDTYEEMEIRNPGSLKLAQSGNPERWAIGVGRSFMNWNTRNTFQRGVGWAMSELAHEKSAAPAPQRTIQWQVFPDLVERKTQISTHTQRYQVVLATLTMVARDFGLPVYIDHGEWYGSKLAGLAKSLGVNAIVGPREIDLPSPTLETDGKILGIAASYQKNGHDMIGFNTDSPVVPQEELQVQASVAVRYGLDDERMQSIRGLTIVPAKTSGIDARVGSLAPGKDADILVTNGDPVDPRNAVEMVFLEGRRVYDAKKDKRRW